MTPDVTGAPKSTSAHLEVAFLTRPQVLARYQISIATLKKWTRTGAFPRAVHLAPAAKNLAQTGARWALSELLEYEDRCRKRQLPRVKAAA
jgi:predicted DNA-binding transcriptional regulator AlpA